MSFPRSFYKEKSEIILKPTATPTGVLVDGTPLSLVNKTRPWLRIEREQQEEALQKKTLIFAFPLYNRMARHVRSSIMSDLRDAKDSGFKVLIQWPDGSLKKWEGQDLPSDYALDWKKFSAETIRQSAWKEYQLAAESTYLIDYFGCNELQRKPRYQLSWYQMYLQHDFALDLISQAASEFLMFRIYSSDKLSIGNFSQLLGSPQHADLIKKFKGLIIADSGMPATTQEEKNARSATLGLIFKNLQQLNSIEINDYDLSPTLENISPQSLHSLKQVELINCNVTFAGFYHLLRSAPQLESIVLKGCKITDFQGPFPGLLSQTKIIRLEQAPLSEEAFMQLLLAAPSLKELVVGTEHADFIKKLPDRHLAHLRDFSICSPNGSSVDITQHLVEMIRVAPSLTSLYLPPGMIIDWAQFRQLRASKMLREPLQWRSVTFDKGNNVSFGLQDLFQMAPFISSLTINNIQSATVIERWFLKKPLQIWSSLEELSLSWSQGNLFETNSSVNFLKAIASLKKLRLNGDILLNALLPTFDPGCLRNLEELTLRGVPMLNRAAFRALLDAAPRLKKVTFSSLCTIDPPLEQQDLQRVEVVGSLQRSSPSPSHVQSIVTPVLSSQGPEQSTEAPSRLSDEFLDTQAKKSELSYYEYFPGIRPSFYRLSLWRPHLDSLEGVEYFMPKDFEPIPLASIDYTKDPSFVCQKGALKVTAKAGETILLPSLDAEEKLFNLEIIDAQGKLVEPKDMLQYSNSTQFHGIKLPEGGEYSIHFQVAYPAAGGPKARPKLPHKINALVDKYNSYKEAKEPPDRKITSLRVLAEHVNDKGVGACRHRAIAAYAELEKEYQEDVRIQLSDVHARVELKIEGRWHCLDLGGYPVKLNKREMGVSALPIKELPEAKVSIKPSSFGIKATTMSTILDPTATAPALVLAGSDLELRDFYQQLAVYGAENIFIAHEPEALNLSGFGMTQAGEIKPQYTDFKHWIDQPGAVEESRVICVDARRFNDSELAQLNDLLEGQIENQKLPPRWKVVVIDKPERAHYGPDFRRRVPTTLRLASSAHRSLLVENPLESQESKETLLTKEIDLYGSPYWQRLLLGSWQVKEDKSEAAAGLAFQWKKEGLLNLDSPYEKIVFKNPPLYDPAFKMFIAELESLRQLTWADQITAVSPAVRFYQSNGYAWKELAKKAELARLTGMETKAPYFLSDANILSFIQDPCYGFSPKTQRLEPQKSYLERSKLTGEIAVVCVPGLSEGALAQFLTEAQRCGVQVRFLTPHLSRFPQQSPLRQLFTPQPSLSPVGEVAEFKTPIDFQLAQDPYFSARQLLATKQEQQSTVSCFDVSCLEANELGRTASLPEKIQATFLKTGKLSIYAPLGAIAQKLKAGEEVILQGKIPSHLYEQLASLSLGYIEGERFTGKLTIIAPPEDQTLLQDLTGQRLPLSIPKPDEKTALLQQLYPEVREYKINTEGNFAAMERAYLKAALGAAKAKLDARVVTGTDFSDAARAQEFDEKRLRDTQLALKLNPWVMIEGPTGIGKTHFLQEVLPQKEELVYSLSEWLTKKAQPQKNLVLVMDEASFISQLSGEGENFLERFKGLKDQPPHFLWKGIDYPLSGEHKVVFAFNPASYGAGRSTRGFLSENELSVSFQSLPDFYVRARTIRPALEAMLPEAPKQNLDWACDPLSKVYNWIMQRSFEKSLITPREIKLMVNIIASQVKALDLQEPDSWGILASEVAYQIGRQTLLDLPDLLKEFDKNFKPLRRILGNQIVPGAYLNHQHEAYRCFSQLMQAREFLLKRFKPGEPTDLGLGSIALESGAGVGKTHFMEQLAAECVAKGVPICHIRAAMPYAEKQRLLIETAEKGGVVIAHEWNTCPWPNQILNNLMMGMDPSGKKRTETPGFMFWTTQNPPSFGGRSEEDPAIRRRMMKLVVDWPVYQPSLQKKEEARVEEVGLFAHPVMKKTDAIKEEAQKHPGLEGN